MVLKEWLIPQDKAYFELLGQESTNVLDGIKILSHIMNDGLSGIEEKRRILKEIEHKGDEIVNKIFEKLNGSFITPFDQEDISRLASLHDDVLDIVFGVVNRIYLFEITEITKEMKEMTEKIVQGVEIIHNVLSNLRRMSKNDINRNCMQINTLENQVDEIFNESLASLFKERDLIRVLKYQEIYDRLELIADKCEDLADVIRDIAIKQK